jgi:hypothetical protein
MLAMKEQMAIDPHTPTLAVQEQRTTISGMPMIKTN